MEGLAKCQFTKQQNYSSICRNHFIHKKTQILKEQYCGFDNVSLSVEYMTVQFVCIYLRIGEILFTGLFSLRQIFARLHLQNFSARLKFALTSYF